MDINKIFGFFSEGDITNDSLDDYIKDNNKNASKLVFSEPGNIKKINKSKKKGGSIQGKKNTRKNKKTTNLQA